MAFAFERFTTKKPRYIEILAIYMISVVWLAAASNAEAATVVLEWESDSSPAIVGNKVYYGSSSRNYQYSNDVGNSESCSISGLQEGKTYYFAATSYSATKTESDYSQELVYRIPESNLDSDNDAISDDDELKIYGTNPNRADTDGDGVKDGEELSYWGNEWNDDVDGDGIINLIDYDSDNDGLSDGYEIYSTNNPLVPDSTPTNELVLDDGDPGTSATGTWQRSSGADPFGSQSLYSKNNGATYRFESPMSGDVDVMLWWTQHSSRSTSVPVEIYDGANLIDTVYVDQLQNGGMWNLLGSYTFNGSARVVIKSTSSSQTTSADAVRFVPQYDIGMAPKITSSAVSNGQKGQQYIYDVKAVGDPSPEFGLLSAPPAMDIDPSTGVITWLPTSAGFYDVTVQVSNLSGSDDQSFTIEITDPANEVITDSAEEVILDDGDPGTSATGTWQRSSGADPFGSQSLYSKNNGATYRFESPMSGDVDVMLWWTQHSSRSTSVPVEIYDGANLIDTVYVDQLQNGGMWNLLGSYTFNGSARVVIKSTSSSQTTSADAVRFVPQYGKVTDPANDGITDSPDEVILDDSDPGTSTTSTPRNTWWNWYRK